MFNVVKLFPFIIIPIIACNKSKKKNPFWKYLAYGLPLQLSQLLSPLLTLGLDRPDCIVFFCEIIKKVFGSCYWTNNNNIWNMHLLRLRTPPLFVFSWWHRILCTVCTKLYLNNHTGTLGLLSRINNANIITTVVIVVVVVVLWHCCYSWTLLLS